MPRSVYDGDDDDEMMFRLPSSSRNSPAPRQLGWSGGSSFDSLDPDSHPAFMSSDGLAVPPGRSVLALPAPPSSSPLPRASATPRVARLDGIEASSSPRMSSSRSSQTGSFPIDPKTPYEVLGLRSDATQEEIKKAYKKAALRFHPDMCKGGVSDVEESTRRFQLVGEAFAILGDRKYRPSYRQHTELIFTVSQATSRIRHGSERTSKSSLCSVVQTTEGDFFPVIVRTRAARCVLSRAR